MTFTTARPKIAVPMNGVEVQWAPVASRTSLQKLRRINLTLQHSMPWFHHYAVTMNIEHRITSDPILHLTLWPGQHSHR